MRPEGSSDAAVDTAAKPTLRGTTVVLRPIGPSDARDLLRATCDPESRRLTGTHATFTLEQIERWCVHVATAEGRVDLAITDAETGVFVGEVVLNDIDEANRCANFRIALAGPEHFGRGYGTEASRLMLRYGFDVLDLHRIELDVFAFNARAIHVYEKLGFKREGVRREALRMDGAFHDSIQMGMLAFEFEA